VKLACTHISRTYKHIHADLRMHLYTYKCIMHTHIYIHDSYTHIHAHTHIHPSFMHTHRVYTHIYTVIYGSYTHIHTSFWRELRSARWSSQVSFRNSIYWSQHPSLIFFFWHAFSHSATDRQTMKQARRRIIKQ